MNTTQTDKQNVLFWWGLWVALMILVFGAPFLTARFMLLPGEGARLALLEGKNVQPEELARFEASRLRVAGWFHVNAVPNDLTVLSLEHAKTLEDEAAAEALKKAEDWQRRALLLTPADAYGWFRLAYLLMRTEGPSLRAAQAWTMSMESAPFEPRLLLPRLQMGMRLASFIDEENKGRFPGMIRALMIYDRDGLVRVARSDVFVSEVEAALADDPEQLDDFIKQLSKDDK